MDSRTTPAAHGVLLRFCLATASLSVEATLGILTDSLTARPLTRLSRREHGAAFWFET